jgi:hypothetical protein
MFSPMSLGRDERRQRHRVADQGGDGDVISIILCLATYLWGGAASQHCR